MVGDTGAEVHVIGAKDRCYMMNVCERNPPCVLDTANGTIYLTEQGDVLCAGILLRQCVFNPHVQFSLASISCLVEDGWHYTQGQERCCLVRGDVTKTLMKSGGLCLLGDTAATARTMAVIEASSEIVISANDEILLRVPKMQYVKPAVMPQFEKDGVSLQHLRLGHKPYDQNCTTCQMMKMRTHQHRRTHTEAEPGQVSADLAGPWPESVAHMRYCW